MPDRASHVWSQSRVNGLVLGVVTALLSSAASAGPRAESTVDISFEVEVIGGQAEWVELNGLLDCESESVASADGDVCPLDSFFDHDLQEESVRTLMRQFNDCAGSGSRMYVGRDVAADQVWGQTSAYGAAWVHPLFPVNDHRHEAHSYSDGLLIGEIKASRPAGLPARRDSNEIAGVDGEIYLTLKLNKAKLRAPAAAGNTYSDASLKFVLTVNGEDLFTSDAHLHTNGGFSVAGNSLIEDQFEIWLDERAAQYEAGLRQPVEIRYMFPFTLERGQETIIDLKLVTSIDDEVILSDRPICFNVSNDGLRAGQTTTWSMTGAVPGEVLALVYGTQPGFTGVYDVNRFCAFFDINAVRASRLLGQPVVDSNGEASVGVRIPPGVSGMRVLTQAAQRDTCPDMCMSNLLDQVVQ